MRYKVAHRQRDGKWCETTEEQLKQSVNTLGRLLDGLIGALVWAAETRDPTAIDHGKRVAQLAAAIAAEMNLPEEQVKGIQVASLVHDLGKIPLPIDVLHKPSRLSEVEFNLVKCHPRIGYEVLKKIEFPWPVAEVALQHHERVDGTGYPSGLSGNDVLLEARIVGVADVVEAMASPRPYRPALCVDKALDEIIQKKGVLYDPTVAETCVKLFHKGSFKFL